MELKDIASVSGKSGLFRIINPTRTGFLLESMDEVKSKLAVPASQKISVLEEISIYVNTAEGTIPLKNVLIAVKKTFGESLPVAPDAEPTELRKFMSQVLPEYDEARVYNSDIKKLVRWYQIICIQAPEILSEA